MCVCQEAIAKSAVRSDKHQSAISRWIEKCALSLATWTRGVSADRLSEIGPLATSH